MVWPIQVFKHFKAILIGSLSNKWKNRISRVFYVNVTITATCLKFIENSSIYVLDMYNEFCPLNFDAANPNLETFLSNIEWKLVKQLENSDLYSIFHNAIVTTNFF